MIIEEKKGKVVAITSYCDTEDKLSVLIVNISLLRSYFPDYKIALHANYPLETCIQKLVDMYFYEDLNHVDEDKWIYYWNIISDGKDSGQLYFNKKFYYSIPDTGFSVFQQIRVLTEYLIEYEWVMLINYDTAVEEIKPQDYSKVHPLTVHYFPGHKAFSLIMMHFKPLEFFKVTQNFTFENWYKRERVDQLNEERFFDMINESGIKYHTLDYKVPDRVSGEPDYLKPNAPVNPYFNTYLLCLNQANELEVYLWGLTVEIETIELRINNNIHQLKNHNKVGAFEHILKRENNDTINSIEIRKINDNITSISLKIKKGYETRPI